MTANKAAPSSPRFATLAEVTRACGVDRKTTRAWVEDPAFPARTAEGWPAADVLEWAAKKMSAHAKQITGKNADVKAVKLAKQVEKITQDIRRAKADADMAEIEAKRAAGQVITREDHNARMAHLARMVNGTIEALPRDLAALCPDAAVVKALRDKVDGMRHALADAVRDAGL